MHNETEKIVWSSYTGKSGKRKKKKNLIHSDIGGYLINLRQ